MIPEILPCPFCQSNHSGVVKQEPAVVPSHGALYLRVRLYVHCANCGARGSWIEGAECGDLTKQSIELWNRFHAQQKPSDKVDPTDAEFSATTKPTTH